MASSQLRRTSSPLTMLALRLFGNWPPAELSLEQRPWVASVDNALLRAIQLGIVVAVVGPLVAALAGLGRSNTIPWIEVGFWLLTFCMLLIGVSAVTNWAGGARDAAGNPLGRRVLFSGVAMILIALCLVAMWSLLADQLPAALVLAAATLLLLLLAASGVVVLVADQGQPLATRLVFLLARLSLGAALLLGTLQDAPGRFGLTPDSPLISSGLQLALLLISVIGHGAAAAPGTPSGRWTSAHTLLLGLILLALLLFVVLPRLIA